MKVFKVTGQICKPNLNTPFVKEVVADKEDHAVELVYTQIGSKHRVRRYHMRIDSVQEIKPEDIDNPILKKMVTEA